MSNPSRAILVVDDDGAMRDACCQTLAVGHHRVSEASTGEAALAALGRQEFDVVVLDVRMPGPDGMQVLGWIRQHARDTAVVVITGYATVDQAVEAMKLGATDFLTKPFTPDMLRRAVDRALVSKSLSAADLFPGEEADSERSLIGMSQPMQTIHELIARVGPTDSTVLVTGESGTGKEVVARAIRDHSLRKLKPFVVVDCGALVGALFESELFGHVKGSFTGATATKHGRLELADGGTLFFDEIGNVPPEIQAKLLRVIQEREFTRVGSHKLVSVDVRILAATSRNLPEEIRQGRFREDLYYRLCVVPIIVPPLRQRVDDIQVLARHFLDRYNRRRGKRVLGFDEAALAALLRHSWPGNVRELENTVERAVVLARGSHISLEDLMWLDPTAQALRPKTGEALREVEREHILQVLDQHQGNRTAAARALGIDRKTLARKLKG